MNSVTQNLAAEWSFLSNRSYTDPFTEIEMDVLFTDSSGDEYRVPAFWAGGNIWRVRFSFPKTGVYRYRTLCSDVANADLHGVEGEFAVTPYTGLNPLLQHGPLRVSADKRHLEHYDGTPFFWLADTWWMGLCRRLGWPRDFQTLTLDRVDKGFSVVQIVAGLYPDMPEFDERGANEVGFPWERDFSRIVPEYFDLADRRISYLIETGLVPCIVGCWGYFLGLMGVEKLKQHWRYLIARYGAYPVVWCLAGEATMPYYLSDDKTGDARKQKTGWTEIAAYVRRINAFGNPVTIHPTQFGREQVDDPSLMDFEMLQTGHGGDGSFPNTVHSLETSLSHEPRMPVLVSEVNYEGILEHSREEIQRRLFWCCMLSGAMGHTYGANGIWQVNTKQAPFGLSPHGTSWGDLPWDEAARLPGSQHLGIAKKILERYSWWQFESHPEWVEFSRPAGVDSSLKPYAAGIPGKLRVIYFDVFPLGTPSRITLLEPGIAYKAKLINPGTGEELDWGMVTADSDGAWLLPKTPIMRDWVLVLEA